MRSIQGVAGIGTSFGLLLALGSFDALQGQGPGLPTSRSRPGSILPAAGAPTARVQETEDHLEDLILKPYRDANSQGLRYTNKVVQVANGLRGQHITRQAEEIEDQLAG